MFHDSIVCGIRIAIVAQREQAPVPTMFNRLRLARCDLRAAITRLPAKRANPTR